MDSLHALGYSMVIPRNTEHLLELWTEYHDNVELILWEYGEQNSSPCYKDPKCVFIDPIPENGVPPPNSTHYNIPVWYVRNRSVIRV
jgi:hypothetical protein